MQTPAEKHLVQTIASFLITRNSNLEPHRILNAGAGQSVSIEQQLIQAGCIFKCDRIDIEDCTVAFQMVRNCWQCSIDDMWPLNSDRYIAAFANYVFEHVENVEGASRELFRVLAPGGLFVATLPNVQAPEFVLSRHTPYWFHKLLRQQNTWETAYAYENISSLLDVFINNGFQVVDEQRWPIVEAYLEKYPIIGEFGKFYDRLISIGEFKRYMGDACITLRKPG